MSRMIVRRKPATAKCGIEAGEVLGHRLMRFAHQSLALLLSGLLIFQPAIANAQSISASTTAPVANQPSVGAAPNGVPLVDIVTPNAAGLSHNKYNDLNVGTQGAILNNFKGEEGTSNLGGVTPGNPNLNASNPASVILNEVTSGNRSALNGPTEVFGTKADVIVANPNGITCNGCGFINTPHATLTTGVPTIGADGSLTGFTVNGGDVTFEGAGGNFAASPGSVDLFDVVSRSIHVNGPVYGKTLRLTAGANKYDYATGEATALTSVSGTPEYAIDGTALGAMQADRIKMVVTEKGAGVNMSGDMAANAGDLTLSADGKISIGNVSGSQGVSITSKSKVTAAKVSSKAKLAIQADAGITLQSVAADDDIALSSGADLLSVTGDVNSAMNVAMTSAGGISGANVTAGGIASLSASAGNISLTGAVSSKGALSVTATSGAIAAASLLSYNNIGLTAGLDISIAGTVFAQGKIAATGRSISTGATVSGLDIAATQADAAGRTVLASAADLQLTATSGAVNAASLLSSGNITVDATSLTAQTITGHGTITINATGATAANGLVNVSGQILGGSDIAISGAGIQATTIASGVDFTATDAAGGNITLGTAGTLDLTAAAGTIDVDTLLSAGDLTAQANLLQANNLTSHGNIDIDAGVDVASQLLGAGAITINGNANGVSTDLLASGVDFAATKATGGNIVLASSGDLTIDDSTGAVQIGTILAAGAIDAVGQTITADTVTGHKDITLAGATSTATGSGRVDVSGQVLGGGNVSVSGSSIAADAIVSGVDIAATDTAGGTIVLGTTAAGTGNLTLTASGALTAGTLLSSGDLNASAASITADNISAHGDMTLGGAISVSDQILGAGNVLITGQSLAAQTLIAGIDFDATNAAGGTITLTSSGDLTVAVSGAITAPTIQAAGNLNASGATITADAITAHNDITLAGATNVSGQVLGGSDIDISGSSIKAGVIVSGVDFAATAASGGGIALANSGDLTLAATADIDVGTLLSAGDLHATGTTVTADSITAHGDMMLGGAISVTDQILGAGNVSISGQSLSAQTLVAGIDFDATDAAGGNITLGQTGDLTVSVSGAAAASTVQAAGVIDVNAATVTADTITGHQDISLSGATTVNSQVLGGGDITVSGSSIKAGTIVSGVDFAATAASGSGIVLASSGDLSLTATGIINASTLLSAGDLNAAGSTVTADSLTAHGDVTLGGAISVSDQILGSGNVSITGQSLSAQTLVAGIDFDATNVAGGTIVFGQTGDLTVSVSGGAAASTIQAAGAIDVTAASVTSDAITGHKDIILAGATSTTTASGRVDISGQVLGGGNIDISGSSIKAGAVVSGVDFAATSAGGGNIVLANGGDLTLASTGIVDAGTLLSAGDLNVTGTSVSADSVTAHGDIMLGGAIDVSGQILSSGNVSITGQSLSAQTLVAGIDFDATKAASGNIVLGQTGDLTVSASGAAVASTIQAAGVIDVSGATVTADTITGHQDISLSGATRINGQVLGGGDVTISGSSIEAGTIVSGVDFAATSAGGGNIVLAGSGDLTLTSTGNVDAGTLLSAGDLNASGTIVTADAVTAHGDVMLGGAISVSGQILGAGNVSISGQSLSAQTLIAGIDFDATNAVSGNIVLGQTGDLTVSVSGAAAASTIQAAGAIDISAASVTSDAITGHKDITLSGTTAVSGQVLGGGNIDISGSSITASAVVSGIDFDATVAAGGNIVLASSGDLTLTSAGDINTGTLLSAGDLSAAGSTVTADAMTAHGDVTLGGAIVVNGQVLGSGNVLITGQSLSAQTLVAGIDFDATNAAGGDIVLGQAGDLTVAVSGNAAASTMQAAGAIDVSAATLTADAITGHQDITLAGATTVNGQVLGGGDITISGSSITAGAIVSGVDSASTAAASGNIVQTVSGDVWLTSTGDLSIGTLLSAGELTAQALDLTAGSITSHGTVDLKASGTTTGTGRVDVSGQVLSAGNLTIDGSSLSAGLLVSGVDFAATDAAGGNIVLGSSGAMNLTVSGDATAGTILSAGDFAATAADLQAGSITSHGKVGINGNVDVTSQILAAGDLTINGSSISAPVLISGIDFAATTAAGGNIVLGSSGAMNLTATGDIVSQIMLSAGDFTAQAANLRADGITSHGKVGILGNVDVSNQVLAAGNLTINGGSISAPTLISGIDFAATNAAGGSIVLASSGAMDLYASAGLATSTMLSAGDIDASAATITAGAVTAHGDVTLAGSSSVIVTGQLLSADDVSLSGQAVQVGQAVTGVDFASTAQSSNGAIALGSSGDLDIVATSVTAGTLIVAGSLDVAASALTGGNITSHGTVAIGSSTSPGAIAINGQLLGASDVSITGSSISGNVIVAGVDFTATSQSASGNIVLGNAGDLTLQATSGDISVSSLMAAGSITANAAGNVSTNAVAHGDLTVNAGNAITLSGQSLAARNANLAARSMTINSLVSGVDFAATSAASGGSLMLQHTGAMTLAASSGSINANVLLSGGSVAATATQNIGYASLQSLGNATLTAPGSISYTSTTRVGGNLTLNTGALDLSGSRGSAIAGAGTLIVNASSANLSGSNLVFGGLTLNLSGNADLSNADVSAVTNGGGSGDITVSAAGLTTTAGTSLLAAHDLTLNLPSLGNAGLLAAGNDLTFNVSGDFYNSPSGLVFAGNNANFFVGGVLTNDQGAIVANNGLTIQGATAGQRNAAVANVSGLIQAGGDMSILTGNLSNRRSAAPTWVMGQLVSSGAVVGTFVLNPAVAGQPFAYLESTDQNMFQLYAGVDPGLFSDYQPLLYSVATLADGTSYRAWTWVSGSGPTEVRPIFDWIKARVPKDANGNPVLDPNNPSRYFIVDEVVRSGSDTSTTYTWDGGANISQSVYEDRFTASLSAEAVIHAGGNLTIDATNLTNSYSSIEADGNATLRGSALTNEGVALYRTTTLTCSAESACTAYNANGTADPSRNIANGTSIVSNSQIIGGASGNIKAAGALSLSFGAINNSSAAGSVSGGAGFAALSNPGNPLSALNSMTAGGALFNVNAALTSVAANGGASVSSGPSLGGGSTTIGSVPTVSSSSLMAVGASISGNNLTAASSASVNGSILTASGASISGGSLTANGSASLSGNGVTAAGGPSINSTALTTGGASVNPNSLMGKLTAAIGNNGNLAQMLQVNGAQLAALAKPQSGGVGGTVPGQVFLFETRAAFLDVSKFYGSAYFIDRIGYTPETQVPFLGDAYFDNQLIDEQMRQLVGDGLGSGSFIPGNNATDQMKSLLDNGVAYAETNGLALGQALTPEQAASLTQSIVIYQTEIVDGAQVLVPVVYLSAADRAKVNNSAAVIAGNTVSIDAGSVDNSGAIAAADGMTINATDIKANGGVFLAGGNMNLNATNGITLAAQTMNIGGQNVVNTNAGISAAGNLQIAAGGTLNSQGAKIATGGSAQLSGQTVTLAATKVDNGGQQNATGTRITAGTNLGITADGNVNISASTAKAGGNLTVTAKQGPVNVISTDVARLTNDGYTKTAGIDQQASQLIATGNLVVNGNTGLLISGAQLSADGSVGLTSKGDINISTSQSQSSSNFGANSSSSTTHTGSEITAGGDLVAKSGGDLNVIGSKISAEGSLGLQATGDVTIAEATDSSTLDVHSSSKKSGFLGTSIKEKASGHLDDTTAVGSSISGRDGTTIISGGDTTVSASTVTAGDSDHVADLSIQSGGNLVVTAGKDNETENDSAKRKGFLRNGSSSYDGYNETTVGSALSASGDVNLDAGKAAVIAGSKVDADGSINVSGDSVAVIGAQENHQSDLERKDSGLFVGSGGGFISLYGKNEKDGKQSSTDNVGSELSAGEDVNLTARKTNLNIMGSSISADQDINLSAAQDVNVTPGAESSSESQTQKKSGFGLSFSTGGGGFSIGIGAQKTKDETAQQSDTNAISTLTAGRDLNISAGNNVNLQATSASAERDVNLFANNDINLLSANDVTNYQEVHEKTFAGVTLTVSSQVGKAAQSIYNSAERLTDSGGVNAVTNTAIAALGFYQGYLDLKQGYQQLNGTDKDKKGLQFDISLSAGISHQESSSSSTVSNPVVTDIRAGRSITMEAENGSITSDGAQILAGYDKSGLPTISGDPLTGDIFLSAEDGDINLNAATGTSDSSSSNSSWSASVGVGFSCGTKGGCEKTGVYASASYGEGGSGTRSVTHTNTHVDGTGDVTIVTNDLALRGATVTGGSVTADVKNLTIESLVDTAKANADQLSLSGTVGIGSFNVSGVTQNAKGDAVLVSEQSGIHAGTGGLDINVAGQTTLVGGLITSDASAERNSFSTGTLTVSDIDTHSTWKADTYGGSIGTNGLSIAPPVKDGDSATGKAYSVIGSNIGITIIDPAHQVQDISTIRRDTTNTNTSLPSLPDLQNILQQQYKTQADLQAAEASMAGLVATIANDFMLKAQTDEERAFWGEGGAGRALLHAIGGGLLGGVNGWEGALKGALGGATSTLLASAISDLVDGMLKGTKYEGTEEGRQLATLLGQSLSALAAGAISSGEGAAYAAANYKYNYLADKDLFKAVSALKRAEACQSDCAEEWAVVRSYQKLSLQNDVDLMTTCKADPGSDACRSKIDAFLQYAARLDRAGIDVFPDRQPGDSALNLDIDADTLAQFTAGKGAVYLDVILARYVANAVNNNTSIPDAIDGAMTEISRTNTGMAVGAIVVLAGAGAVVAPEVYAYCMFSNPIACTQAIAVAGCVAATVCPEVPPAIVASNAAKAEAQLEELAAAETAAAGTRTIVASDGTTVVVPAGYKPLTSAGAAANDVGGLPQGYLRVVDEEGNVVIAGPNGAIYDDVAAAQKAATIGTNVPNNTAQVIINWQNGTEFEQQVVDAFGHVGGAKNTTPVTVILHDGTQVTTVPDLWGANVGGMLEAKNVQNLSMSNQLRAQIQAAIEAEQPLNLVVSPRTQNVSGPLINGVRSTGGNVYVYNPATDSLTLW